MASDLKEMSDLTWNGQPRTFADDRIKPNIVISWNGRSATINFGGDAVEFHGDLPASEAAQEFFKHVHILRQQARDAALEECEAKARAISNPHAAPAWNYAIEQVLVAIRSLRRPG